ncbi:MAG: hypothetical protein IJA67_14530 [Oscillospiraceae bacterium]|nr:hypothetical protein [Oscillospiraceae bacterium]
MKKIRTIGSFVLMIITCITFAGCDVFNEAMESVRNTVDDYDKGIAYLLDPREDLADIAAMYTAIPYENLSGCAITENMIDQYELTDEYGNLVSIQMFSAKSTEHTGQIAFVQVLLENGLLEKDRLQTVLSDTKALIETYESSCDKLLITYLDKNYFINWYVALDFLSDKNDRTMVMSADYISYIDHVYNGVFTAENKDYYYDCQFAQDIYDIDLTAELTSEQITVGDKQNLYKSQIDPDILNCLEYYSFNLCLYYEVYLDEEEGLTVILYPEEDGEYVQSYALFREADSRASEVYEHYTLIQKDGYDGDVIYRVDDGEITVDNLNK